MAGCIDVIGEEVEQNILVFCPNLAMFCGSAVLTCIGCIAPIGKILSLFIG